MGVAGSRRWALGLGGLLALACGETPTPSPSVSPSASPSASPSPSPSPSPSASHSATPTPSLVGPTPTAGPGPEDLVVEVVDSQGVPWAGALVFAGLGGLGPAAETDLDGQAVLRGVGRPVTVSVWHTYSARYSARDSYTVNRISTWLDLAPVGALHVELFRDPGYDGEPRVVATPEGALSEVDAGRPDTRLFVVGGDGEWTGEPTAPVVAWGLDAYTTPAFLYASQVEIDPDGVWRASAVPMRFDLVLDPPREGGDLLLTRSFEPSLGVTLSGVDAAATRLDVDLTWTLPAGRGALVFTDTWPLPAPPPLLLPPADAAWAGDRLGLRLSAAAADRAQVVEIEEVHRDSALGLAVPPVPGVRARYPLRSADLAGLEILLSETSGADTTLFYFTERWFRPGGAAGSFFLWYDVWTVEAAGGPDRIDLPMLPTGVPWPGDIGASYSLLERDAYVEVSWPGGGGTRGEALRHLPTAASEP